ncbi:MAG: hypothetical protein AAF480_04065 [Actinomycetota bacterium]
MEVDDAEIVSTQLLGAAGIAPGEVPPRRFGADWFREQPAWLAATVVADRLVHDAALDPGPALLVAEDVLANHLPDTEAAQLIEVGFVEAMICASSHSTEIDGSHILQVAPQRVWSTWHRRRERLEALSEMPHSVSDRPKALDDADDDYAMMARCTTYRAESGRHVVLADLISSDRPSPWPLRHPLLTGLVFGAVMAVLLLLSLVRQL